MTQDSTMRMDRTSFEQWKAALPQWPTWAETCEVDDGGVISFYGAPQRVHVTDSTTTTGEPAVFIVRLAQHHYDSGEIEGPLVDVGRGPRDGVSMLLPSDALALARALEDVARGAR